MRLSGMMLCVLPFAIAGCSALEGNSTAHIPSVQNFDARRYMGRWYEQMRLENAFEEGLHFVTADYSLNADGSVKVVNSGVNVDSELQVAEGHAELIDLSSGELNVKFSFWQFEPARYRIIELGKDYEYAVVTTTSRRYAWILSREKVMKRSELSQIEERLKSLGFRLENRIETRQQ